MVIGYSINLRLVPISPLVQWLLIKVVNRVQGSMRHMEEEDL